MARSDILMNQKLFLTLILKVIGGILIFISIFMATGPSHELMLLVNGVNSFSISGIFSIVISLLIPVMLFYVGKKVLVFNSPKVSPK